jgi:4-hydroxybenzoate polyprenyltransferase
MKSNDSFVVVLASAYGVLRNILFFIAVFSFLSFSGYEIPTTSKIFTALITFLASYQVIYFINNYSDRFYDLKYKEGNIYTLIRNKNVYWSIFFILLVIGIILSGQYKTEAFYILLSIYIFSTFYSLPPVRLKDIYLIRFLSLGVIYSLKFLYCSNLLSAGLTSTLLPESVVLGGLVSLLAIFYKKDVYKKAVSIKQGEIILSTLTFVSVAVYYMFSTSSTYIIFLIISFYSMSLYIAYRLFMTLGLRS